VLIILILLSYSEKKFQHCTYCTSCVRQLRIAIFAVHETDDESTISVLYSLPSVLEI
jgi:hypothetical protein